MSAYTPHYMDVIEFSEADIYCQKVHISKYVGVTPIPVPDIEIISPLDSSGSDK
ncbi:MAG: hypothetical protein LIO80_05980 [Lachnospiraceae bacterium]|nr:hypothetical protein [Lachnospiraceae bacterium]